MTHHQKYSQTCYYLRVWYEWYPCIILVLWKISVKGGLLRFLVLVCHLIRNSHLLLSAIEVQIRANYLVLFQRRIFFLQLLGECLFFQLWTYLPMFVHRSFLFLLLGIIIFRPSYHKKHCSLFFINEPYSYEYYLPSYGLLEILGKKEPLRRRLFVLSWGYEIY